MLVNNESGKKEHEGFVVAMNDNDIRYEYPPQVKLTIREDHQKGYLKAAKFINLSSANLHILEHEFGIFGGQSGKKALLTFGFPGRNKGIETVIHHYPKLLKNILMLFILF